MAKERLDVLVMERGFAESREKAKALIMAGEIFVDGEKEDKAGMKFSTEALIEYHGNPIPYVGRGGLKLEKALAVFKPDLTGRVCMDVGASTGGFTDCMLQNGAAKVYSVDVGRGQLAWKLREDSRVVCMEKTNIRYLTAEAIEEHPFFVSIDVSFISLTKVLLPVRELMTETGEVVCLVKPQFEAGREKVGKKGVVRDPDVHREVIRQVARYAESIGFAVCGIDYSPIKGPEGNIEYLLYLKKGEASEPDADAQDKVPESDTDTEEPDAVNNSDISAVPVWEQLLRQAVQQAHESLT
ncbi:MAG: TlyA family RNA methyltransferase [Eubacterium sp.]|nr:TlyA family RNA methyltransferase [Eubacterium sp.]